MSREHHHNHEHAHSCHCHDHSCHCHDHHGHDHGHGGIDRKNIICLAAGAVLFVGALAIQHSGIAGGTEAKPYIVFAICIIAYIILGRNVLISSAKNIASGHVFDENFLMAVATIAAFCIGDFTEAVGVMLFYNIGELFEDISVDKSRERIIEAVDMRPETVSIVRGYTDGENSGYSPEEVPAETVKSGDIIQIKPGERIPLDGVLLSGEGILDTSPVTGEPVPVKVSEGSEILSGCINRKGRFVMRVTAPLSESMVSRILESVENAAENKPQVEKFITGFAGIYTPIVVALAVAVAVIMPLVTGGLWKHWIMTAVTFLVISCPCAMVISVPLAYFLGVGAASRCGILFKSSKSLEALRKIKIIAMDKTGTLTTGIVDDPSLLETGFDETAAGRKQDFNKTVTGDTLKSDAKKGVSEVISLGFIPAMLTGDRRDRAEAIAAEAGIRPENVRAELLPDEKLTALIELREKHGEIMFVGDGINDAPVLAGANVGAAMGNGTDAAIESADVVFMNSNVEAIPQAIKISKRTNRIAAENIVIALAIKALILALGFIGFANIWLAVFADTGVAMLCILNSLRLLG